MKIGVSRVLIQDRALKTVAQRRDTNFKASNGWWRNSVRRYNLSYIKIHGEHGDLNMVAVQEIDLLKEMLNTKYCAAGAHIQHGQDRTLV